MFKHCVICLFTLLCCNDAFAKSEFVCKTEKHTVIIKFLSPENYQYNVWNKPKNISKKPDLIVSNGKKTIEGTNPCTATVWTFVSGKVQFVISTPANCTESIPPKNAIGELDVLINGNIEKR